MLHLLLTWVAGLGHPGRSNMLALETTTKQRMCTDSCFNHGLDYFFNFEGGDLLQPDGVRVYLASLNPSSST